MKVMIDTCVIVDFLEERAGAEAAETILTSNEYVKVICAKTVLDLFYLIHHFTHDNAKTVEAIKAIIGVVDEVADTTSDDVRGALSSKTKDYEDAVLIETARRVHADCIITRNIKDYRYSEIPAKLPEDFIR